MLYQDAASSLSRKGAGRQPSALSTKSHPCYPCASGSSSMPLRVSVNSVEFSERQLVSRRPALGGEQHQAPPSSTKLVGDVCEGTFVRIQGSPYRGLVYQMQPPNLKPNLPRKREPSFLDKINARLAVEDSFFAKHQNFFRIPETQTPKSLST